MTKTAVVFGGPSPEHDISVSTGLQAARTLDEVVAVYWSLSGRFHLVDPELEAADFAEGPPRRSKPIGLVAEPGAGFVSGKRPLDVDVVVNCCHGGPGEDGTLQGALDLAGLRYTGPGQAASALGMDKLAFGATTRAAGLPTLPRVLLREEAPEFEPPFIVKPRFGGSSIGIEVVEDHPTALALLEVSPHLTDGAVVEPFLGDARDLQVAVRTYPELQLSAIEAPARSTEGGIYGYRQKYLAWGEGGPPSRDLPASLPAGVEEAVRASALRVAELTGLRSVARIDFLERGGEVWVNEVNTIPGSLAAYLWVDPPVSRRRLLEDMIAEALAAPPRRFTTAGADGTALRNAGTIASKLG